MTDEGMTQGFCTDKGALIAYLYDDCEPGERDRIAAHVADCAECTAELAALTATRSQLAAWVLPHAALGFQVDPAPLAESLRSSPPLTLIEGGAREVGTPEAGRSVPAASWWRQPLPAWAQAAAAVLIFAAGAGFGSGNAAGFGSGNGDDPPGSARFQDAAARGSASSAVAKAPADQQNVRVAPVTATAAPTVSEEELTRLDRKLQAMQQEIAALRAASATRPAVGSENNLTLAQVRDLVSNSEVKMQNQVLLLDGAFQQYVERVARLFPPAQRAQFQEAYHVEPGAALNSAGKTIGLTPISYRPTR